MHVSFQNVVRREIEWLECSTLSELSWLMHAFTTRRGGLDLSRPVPEAPAVVHDNWKRALASMNADAFTLGVLRQIHSDHVWSASRAVDSQSLKFVPVNQTENVESANRESCGDALITCEPGILLAVLTADCVPILMADTNSHAVAAIHAGWRGTLEGIVDKTVREMNAAFGSKPENLVVAIGPSIRACCYEVGSEVAAEFTQRFPRAEEFIIEKPSRPCYANLDLIAVVRRQLLSAGVSNAGIHVADFCTACRTDLFFSYRKEGQAAGRMAALIGINP